MSSLGQQVYDACNTAIVVTGTARSGTTIIGSAIHSFATVEYAFEPPLMQALLFSSDAMSDDAFKLLYEAYLYEDFLIPALAGRQINTNQTDDSSIYRTKSEEDIRQRLERSWRESELEKRATKSRICYKLPEIAFYLPKVQQFYPGTAIIVMQRSPEGVFRSFHAKGWFSDRALTVENNIWPYTLCGAIKVPFFVDKNDIEYFAHADELHRIAYHYIRMETLHAALKNAYRIVYEDLLSNPERVISDLSVYLGVSFGPKTPKIISSIKPRSHGAQQLILDSLEPDIRKQVMMVSPQTAHSS